MSPKPRRLLPRSRVNAVLHAVYYGLCNAFAHFWVWKQKTKGGALILFDRYYLDYLIQPEFSNCPRWIIKFMLKIMPRPNIVIFLNNEAAIIHQRKRELPVEELNNQLNACQAVLAELKNGHIIHTDNPVKTIVSKVEQLILETI